MIVAQASRLWGRPTPPGRRCHNRAAGLVGRAQAPDRPRRHLGDASGGVWGLPDGRWKGAQGMFCRAWRVAMAARLAGTAGWLSVIRPRPCCGGLIGDCC